MVVTRFKTALFSVMALACLGAQANIDPSAMSAAGNAKNNSQMINLNFQIKSNNKMVKSDLLMPFYQTGELEKKIGDQNVFIEVNPKRGKNADEISLEMKFFRASGMKAFFKKEIIAKINQESKITFRGMSVRVRPVLN